MKYYIQFCISLLLITSVSCKKDFLDAAPKNYILRQEYVKDLTTTGDFLNGIYIIFTKDLYNADKQIYPDLIADDVKPISGGVRLIPHYNWAQISNQDFTFSVNINSFWSTAYQITRACNFTIEKAGEYREQDLSKADDIKGQAYAIRAFTYFLLANMFSQSYGYTTDASHPGIPYVTTYDWTQPVSDRQTVAEVYNNLISDLSNAVELLPNTSSTLNFNKTAAKGLLSKVYLYKGDYNSAKDIAREVCALKPLMQNNYPSKLFTLNETEALFQLSPSWSGVLNGTYSAFFSGYYFAAPNRQFVATNDIVSILRENISDVRNTWVTRDDPNMRWNISKYPSNVVAGFPTGTQAYYPTLLRSSEIYLIAAESYAKINNNDSARFFLDAIRKRANQSALLTTATGTALLDSIYKERRKELSFEGFRAFELLRLKKGVNRIDANSGAPQVMPYPSNKAIAPLPKVDVIVAGLSQNPDY